MSILALGLLFGGVTLLVMFSGMPIAYSLGFVPSRFDNPCRSWQESIRRQRLQGRRD